MEYYKENLEALKAYDEEAYNNYIEWKAEQIAGSELLIEEEVARDGSSVLNITKDSRTYRLNSKYYPEEEAEEWCQGLDLANLEQVVNFFGLGNGIFVRTLRESGGEDMRLIIYEPSIKVFDYLMKNIRVCDILREKNTILLVKGMNEKNLYGILDTLLSWENVDFSLLLSHPQYNKIFEEEYRDYAESVEEAQKQIRIRRNTTGYFGKDIVENLMNNLQYLREAQLLEQYVGKFGADIPAIIVAAGPSLDLNVEKLKEAVGKAVIIATDTAMRELIQHKIRPDFIITVDPKKPSEYLCQEECKDIPIICDGVSNHKILKQHQGKKIFMELSEFGEGLYPPRFAGERKLGRGGSVATAAFSVCVFMDIRKIILVGQDLAYRNGSSHAGGRLDGEEIHGNWLVEVEDIYGNRIKTRHEWYVYLLWFEDAVERVKKKRTIIDATEGGAKIKGTRIMTLEKAVKEFCQRSIDCKALTESLGNAYTEEEYRQVIGFMEKAISDNDKSIHEIKQLLTKINRVIDLCEKKQRNSEYRKLTKDLLRIGAEIEQRPVYRLAEAWCADSVFTNLSGVNHVNDDVEADEIELYRATLGFYKELLQAFIEIQPYIQSALKKMKIKEDLLC